MFANFRFDRYHLVGKGGEYCKQTPSSRSQYVLHATEEDIDALVGSGVVPVLLPGTAFGLGADYADARTFLDAGADVAIATDLERVNRESY